MPESIIEIRNLSKKYIISHKEPYYTLRDNLANLFKKSAKKEEFWALKDINFEVKKGEIIGIIGKNGSGKSTLLKILTQITPLTTGEIKIRGRVSSLLEVGTGFHPELTGRENIFLNGAILGMTRAEIKRKFDEIVAFSEIGQFLDTPVKRYSSGMYVRLAFAVAAHLEPEILLVDEVLAVGDTSFQKKCLGKMNDVAKSGRTIVFVSHNMAAINELCQKCILLDGGKMIAYGKTNTVITKYLSKQYHGSEGIVNLRNSKLRRNSSQDSIFKFTQFSIINSKNQPSARLALYEPFSLVIKGFLIKPSDDLKVAFSIDSSMGFPLFNSFNIDSGLSTQYNKGEISFDVKIDSNILAPGVYSISLGAKGTGVADWIPEVLTINIEQVSNNGKNINPDHGGIIVYPCKWSINNARKENHEKYLK